MKVEVEIIGLPARTSEKRVREMVATAFHVFHCSALLPEDLCPDEKLILKVKGILIDGTPVEKLSMVRGGVNCGS